MGGWKAPSSRTVGAAKAPPWPDVMEVGVYVGHRGRMIEPAHRRCGNALTPDPGGTYGGGRGARPTVSPRGRLPHPGWPPQSATYGRGGWEGGGRGRAEAVVTEKCYFSFASSLLISRIVSHFPSRFSQTAMYFPE